MSTESFTKVVRPGVTDDERAHLFCKIKYDAASGRLSVTGVVGPKRNGNAIGGCGQTGVPALHTLAPGWNDAMVERFRAVWARWHLNDMRAGCEHQRAEGWDERPIDPSKPLDAYGKHFPGQQQDSWNMLSWVRPSEHPDGLLTKPCPECGYRFGSEWLAEAVPADVLDFLRNLPDTDRTPAWV